MSQAPGKLSHRARRPVKPGAAPCPKHRFAGLFADRAAPPARTLGMRIDPRNRRFAPDRVLPTRLLRRGIDPRHAVE